VATRDGPVKEPTDRQLTIDERPHQGNGNVIIFPEATGEQTRDGPMRRSERFSWLLRFYHRVAG
jgi:hypothetical protein